MLIFATESSSSSSVGLSYETKDQLGKMGRTAKKNFEKPQMTRVVVDGRCKKVTKMYCTIDISLIKLCNKMKFKIMLLFYLW